MMAAARRLLAGPRVDSLAGDPPVFAVILGGCSRTGDTRASPNVGRTDAVLTNVTTAETIDPAVRGDFGGKGLRGGDVRFAGPCRRQGSPCWYCRVRDPRTGRRSWRSTGTTVLRAARAIIRRWEVEEAESGVQTLTHQPTVAQSVGHWLEREEARLSPLTCRRLRGVARQWREAWGSMALGDLTSGMLDIYLAGRRQACAATTVNLERRLLLWWLADACRRGEIRTSAAKATERYPEEVHELRVLRGDDRLRLEAALEVEPWDVRLAVVLALETGLRQRAILALRWEWIDTEGGWIALPASALKSRRDLRLPLSPDALAAVRRGQTAVLGPVFRRCAEDLRRHWVRIVHRAGLRGLHFHDLRKTFLTDQCKRGTRMEVAMALSDHRDLRTVLKCYRAIDPEELLRAVGRTSDSARESGA